MKVILYNNFPGFTSNNKYHSTSYSKSDSRNRECVLVVIKSVTASQTPHLNPYFSLKREVVQVGIYL